MLIYTHFTSLSYCLDMDFLVFAIMNQDRAQRPLTNQGGVLGMKLKTLFTYLSLFAMLGFSFAPQAMADEAQLLSMVKNLEKQMASMQSTINAQRGELESLKKSREISVAPSAPARAQELPSWLNGLKMKGDLRLRYEALDMVDSNATRDRNRFRYRLRWGMEKDFGDDFKVGFRLASSAAGGRTSTNTTMDSQFDFDSISIDKAYATYKPSWAKKDLAGDVAIKGLEITAGKFGNPFAKNGSTWITWDSDVTPEGIYEKLDINLLKSEDLDLGLDLTAGQFVVEEGGAGDHDDAELYAWRAGISSKIKGITEKPIKSKHVFTYYDYRDYTKAGNFVAGNNTTDVNGNVGDFDVIGVYNEISMPLAFGLPSGKVFYDLVYNTDALSSSDDTGWALGFKLGKAKKKGAWELGYTYAQIEADAVPSAFTDSDFAGTDARGSVIKAKYALTNNLKFGLAAFFTNRISADADVVDQERRLFQADLAWKF